MNSSRDDTKKANTQEFLLSGLAPEAALSDEAELIKFEALALARLDDDGCGNHLPEEQ